MISKVQTDDIECAFDIEVFDIVGTVRYRRSDTRYRGGKDPDADWMNMTPEDISLAVESDPNPSEGHTLPGILLQEAIEVNGWHHIHDRHYQIITLICYAYTI